MTPYLLAICAEVRHPGGCPARTPQRSPTRPLGCLTLQLDPHHDAEAVPGWIPPERRLRRARYGELRHHWNPDIDNNPC